MKNYLRYCLAFEISELKVIWSTKLCALKPKNIHEKQCAYFSNAPNFDVY